MEIRGGDPVAVPCRGCGRQFLKVRADAQPVQVVCPQCGAATQVVARQVEGEWRIFTAPAPRSGAKNNH